MPPDNEQGRPRQAAPAESIPDHRERFTASVPPASTTCPMACAGTSCTWRCPSPPGEAVAQLVEIEARADALAGVAADALVHDEADERLVEAVVTVGDDLARRARLAGQLLEAGGVR